MLKGIPWTLPGLHTIMYIRSDHHQPHATFSQREYLYTEAEAWSEKYVTIGR